MRFRRYTSVALAIAISMPMMSGCAVGMAMHGTENIDTSIMFQGAPRQVVLAKSGPPETSITNDEGKRVDTYIVTKGNKPSKWRALLHAILYVPTFFIWELVGTMWEINAGRSQTDEYIITYDEDDLIENISLITGAVESEEE